MSSTEPLAINKLLERIRAHCDELNLEMEEALAEKADELEIRAFLRCLPHSDLKSAQLHSFLEESLGKAPPQELMERVLREARGPSLDNDEYLKLEQTQRGRCALCGDLLVPSVRPQVDHIVPVALGGKSHASNYQLLCQQCNLGKSKLVGWVMGAPFFDEGYSCKLKYCVLTRYRGCCTAEDCYQSARTTKIEVLTIVPVQRGGRIIFDNLRTLCFEHASEQKRAWLSEATMRLRGMAAGGSWSLRAT
ncbi:HNH endonuclease [Haliangium sp. UPWRP_2]|nr:HNH endonuclease [Haliangium sp. UPWRP_2]